MISLLHKDKKQGQFTVAQIRKMLAQGQVDGSWYYWMPGMTEWRPFTRSILAPNFRPADLTKQTPTIRATPAKKERIKSEELPLIRLEKPKPALITEKQRAFLKVYGVKCSKKMLRMEASALIDEIINDPNHDGTRWAKNGYGM